MIAIFYLFIKQLIMLTLSAYLITVNEGWAQNAPLTAWDAFERVQLVGLNVKSFCFH